MVLAVVLLGVSCARPRGEPSREEIRALGDARGALIAAATSRDASALAAVYADDAVLMNPKVPDVKGRANIEAAFRSAFTASAIRGMTLSPIDVRVLGDRAYELSTFTQLVETGGKAAAEDHGRVMLVWERKPDGPWKVRYALVNTTLPESPLH